MRSYINLRDERCRDVAINAVTHAPIGHCVVVHEPTRSIEQNSLLHGLLQHLEGREWAGKRRTMEEWKVLMISAHAAAQGRPNEVVTGLEGELVNVRESSAHMSPGRLSSLVEYIQAWMNTEGNRG